MSFREIRIWSEWAANSHDAKAHPEASSPVRMSTPKEIRAFFRGEGTRINVEGRVDD